MIASEYGYTWQDFVLMTYRQLNECLESIARRTHNKVVVNAALHGVKMDLYKKHVPIDKKTLEESKTEVQKILEEKQNQIKNRASSG